MHLNSGYEMPQMGLGVMRFGAEAETATVIGRAVEAGYRLFDTASIYGTEKALGEGLRHAGVPREDVFVTTKLWNDSQGSDASRSALDRSLEQLEFAYLDLYLIHWPLPMFDRYVETWRALIDLQSEGKIRSIGVSNFTEDHLKRLIRETGVAPSVNQVEMHPYFQQRRLLAYHDEHGIVTQAWSPFGGGGGGTAELLADPVVVRIAAKHKCTPSQVILRWHIDSGVAVIPKATSMAHLTENLASVQVQLDAEDVAILAELDREEGRSGPNPMTMNLVSL